MATVEATSMKVQRILMNELDGVQLTKDGFSFEHGSTACKIRVIDWGTDRDGNPETLVHIWAPLVRDVPPSLELYRWASTEGQNKHFGSARVIEGDGSCMVVLSATLLGDYLDTAELMTAIVGVTVSADELDDVVRQRFGGKRYTDE